MEGLFRGERRALDIASAPAAVVLLSGTIFCPQKGSHLCLRVHKRWVWVWAQSLQLPMSLLSSGHVVWPRVYVRVTSIAKYQWFQLLHAWARGEQGVRYGPVFPVDARFGFWGLECVLLCFFGLFCLKDLRSLWLTRGCRGWKPHFGSSGRSQAAAALLPHAGTATFGVPPMSESLLHFSFLGVSPHRFPQYVLWSMYSTQLVTLCQINSHSWDLWGFKILICKLHICKLHVCKLKQLIYEFSQVF